MEGSEAAEDSEGLGGCGGCGGGGGCSLAGRVRMGFGFISWRGAFGWWLPSIFFGGRVRGVGCARACVPSRGARPAPSPCVLAFGVGSLRCGLRPPPAPPAVLARPGVVPCPACRPPRRARLSPARTPPKKIEGSHPPPALPPRNEAEAPRPHSRQRAAPSPAKASPQPSQSQPPQP